MRTEITTYNGQLVKQAARENIGTLLRAYRQAAGLTLRQLGEMTGIAYNHIARIEQGRYNVTVDTLAILGDALGVKITLLAAEKQVSRPALKG